MDNDSEIVIRVLDSGHSTHIRRAIMDIDSETGVSWFVNTVL